MTYKLIIVESPAKCNKIETILGPGYKCISSFGHIRQLSGLKSIDIKNNFKPTFTNVEGKNQQISKLRKMIKECNEVIIASDDDREGEAIGWHICDLFKLPIEHTKRMIFHEITETAIKESIKNLTKINMNVVYAQQARQILDILVGFTISPILWKQISQNKQSLSAGRCQTPALKLIYENQQEIDKSPGKKVYKTIGYFTKFNLPFILNHEYNDEEDIINFLEESVNHEHKFNCENERKVTKNPPLPFTTSSLQQAANNELRMSPKATMSSCQILYENGYITYMRTDSRNYSKEFLDKTKVHINKKYGEEYCSKDLYSLCKNEEDTNDLESKKSKVEKDDKSKKSKQEKKKTDKDNNAQEAHEAIRPTNISIDDLPINQKNITTKEIKLYKLIYRNTLESCMEPANYIGITSTITAPENKIYKYSCEQVIFPGWKIVAGYEKETKEFKYLQTLKTNLILNYNKITSKVTMKDLKTHYTEAKLVKLLEQKGIGRPSTFSSLIEKIQERGYVLKTNIKGVKHKCTDFELENEELSEIETEREFGNENNKLVIQPIGIIVIEFLINSFNDLFAYEYTKNMEDELDLIAKGGKEWHQLCKECLEQIQSLSKDIKFIENKNDNTIKIDEKHTYIIGRYGPVIKYDDGKEQKFIQIKENIDVNKLRDGEYKLKDIISEKNKFLILYEKDDGEVVLKKGIYGFYLEYKEKKKSININDIFDKVVDENILIEKIDKNDINLEKVVNILIEKKSENGLPRKIDENISIRNGKYGDYIFYKKSTMKQPKFLKLNKFIELHGVDSYKTCDISIIKDWIYSTYTLN